MIRRANNNRVLRNSCGKILSSNYSLRLKVTGNSFPIVSGPTSYGALSLAFSRQIKVVVNYGDGVLMTYNTTYDDGYYRFALYENGTSSTTTPPAYGINKHTYSSSGTRFVTFKFDTYSLTSISIAGMRLDVQPLEFYLTQSPNLESFIFASLFTPSGVQGVLTNLNFNGLIVSKVTSINLTTTFDQSAYYSSSIPPGVFQLPLVTFGIGGTHESKTFATSNFDKMPLLKNTLRTFTLGSGFTDAQGLPSNFSELSLTTFNYVRSASNGYTTFPAKILDMETLQTLEARNATAFTSAGNIGSLINLTRLNLLNLGNIETNLPTGINNCPLLKNLDYSSSFRTTARVDEFINNVYTYTITNAPLMGINTNLFRGMNIEIQTKFSAAAIPTGTYRKPLQNILSIDVTNCGSGYTTTPSVIVTGGLGTGGQVATATAVIKGGMVTDIIINFAGYNYSSLPVISFIGGSGSGATATATLAPAYLKGTTNGNPTTPREKMWVMVDQYNHTWTYRSI